MATVFYEDQPVVVGATVTFRVFAEANEAVLDLTLFSANLFLRMPNAVTVKGPYAGAIIMAINPKTGLLQSCAICTVPRAAFDTVGIWQRQWELSTGSVVLINRLKSFPVEESIVS